MAKGISYRQAGVDIDKADAVKKEVAAAIETGLPGAGDRVGPFASLVDASFPGYEHPMLVFKTEEPGSKQLIAFEHDRIESVCRDMVNHLVNDIIVLGARPLAVQDVIICGKLEKETVKRIVLGIDTACREQGCVLTGGEMSEQPGVLAEGRYVLASSIIGVVERSKVVDGSRIADGDKVLAVASNGLHTNGYSLVRALVARDPSILDAEVEGETFLEAILRPHKCYFRAFEGLFETVGLHGMAHITGGGLAGNLARILPSGLDAHIQRDALRIPQVFAVIRERGEISDDEMLRTFNMGVGMALVVAAPAAQTVRAHLSAAGCESYEIGVIAGGSGEVAYGGALVWPR